MWDSVKRSYNTIPYSRTRTKRTQRRLKSLIQRILSLGVVSQWSQWVHLCMDQEMCWSAIESIWSCGYQWPQLHWLHLGQPPPRNLRIQLSRNLWRSPRTVRRSMPFHPSEIWEHLSPELQCQITSELSTILQEVLNEQIRTSESSTPATQGAYLHPTINSAPGALQSRKPASAVRVATASHRLRLEAGGHWNHWCWPGNDRS